MACGKACKAATINERKPCKMKPPKTRHTTQMDWVRIELRSLIDARHPLVELSRKINWAVFDEKYGGIELFIEVRNN
jgi:hypothetical protein